MVSSPIVYQTIPGAVTLNFHGVWDKFINKALKDEINDGDVNKLISTITKKNIEQIENTREVSSITDENIPEKKIEVAEIEEISSISNFGLLNIKEPLELKSNLNVFYGMNGVGKSSIYKAICGPIGVKTQKCIPNINSDSSKMLSRIKIKDKQGNESILEFTGETSEKLDIRIFDNEISRFIISNDRENEFIVPYLKQEYFMILRELLDTISDKLSFEDNNNCARINEIKRLFDNKLQIITEEYTRIETKISTVKYNDADKKIFENLIKTKELLESNTAKLVLQSYKDRLEDIDKIIGKLCDITIVEDKPTYSYKYNMGFIESYTVELEKYLHSKKLFESNNLENIGEYISKDWISKNEWHTFIEAGLAFVASLAEQDNVLYNNKCPYCNQDLSNKSKELIKSYNILKSTYKTDMDKYKITVDNSNKVITDTLFSLKDIDKIMPKVFDVIKEIDDKQLMDVKTSKIISYLGTLKECLDNYKFIDNKDLNDYSLTVIRIIELRYILNQKYIEISKQIFEKNKQIIIINNTIKPLEENRIITENKGILSELVDKSKVNEDIKRKSANITVLKTNLSKLQNSFSDESIMKMFKDKLYEEYKDLHFDPPKKLTIKPQKSRRTCRVGDYKLSDIYSEGELKIHSLAEFFAEAQIDQYRGVYIFDDPVNSLDYERIEYVSNRIKRLLAEGNQILVFTHNIYFLNSLIDTEKDKICEVRKTNEQIYIINDNLLGNKDRPIKQYREKIEKQMNELSRKSMSDIDAMDLSAIYDLMSGCLENYVENILLNGLISRYRPNIRMYNLKDLKSIDNDIIDSIYELYDNTSRYGNRHDSPKETLVPTYDNLLKHYAIFKKIVEK